MASRDYENFSKINKRIADVERLESPEFEMIYVERRHGRIPRGRFGSGRKTSFSRGRPVSRKPTGRKTQNRSSGSGKKPFRKNLRRNEGRTHRFRW